MLGASIHLVSLPSEHVNPTLRRSRSAAPAVALALCLALAACGGGDAGESTSSASDGEALSGAINVDGSSTVFPLSEAAAELFQEEQPDVQVTVGQSGTGGGFQKFCNGETDISNASRPIDEEEIAACESSGVTYQEFQVANDALTVVVNKENDWATCLTVEQLAAIWGPDSTVNNWNQVDPSFPTKRSSCSGREPTPARSTTSRTRSTARKAQAAPTTARPRTTTSSSRASPDPRAASATSATRTSRRTRTT